MATTATKRPLVLGKKTDGFKPFMDPETLLVTKRRSLQAWLRATRNNFTLYEPAPNGGDRASTWGAYDNEGRYWQTNTNNGNTYDEFTYLVSRAKADIWEQIAQSHGYTLEENLMGEMDKEGC